MRSIPWHNSAIHFLAPLRPLASRQGVLAFLEAQMLDLDPFSLGGPAVIVAGLLPGAGKARQADVIISISAA